MVLLIAALQVAGQPYVIDKVCVGSIRQYRIEGDAGSVYEWLLTDASKLSIPIPNPSGTPFTKTKGKTIYGNEITIEWKQTGTFNLSTVQTSLLGCDTLEQGLVEVYDIPTVMAGTPLTVCIDMKVGLATAFAANHSSLLWTSSGDGTFDDPLALNTSYNIGPNDLVAGSVNLTLTAQGLGNSPNCTSSSTLLATFKIIPKLIINDPPEVCLPVTIDLRTVVAAGSDPDLSFEYFTDPLATITLANYMNVNKSGTYYIRATSSSTGCAVFKPVKVKFTKQIVPSFAHIPEDADADGILNVDEVLSGQDWKTTDTDGDGHPNWLDIDADNDGLVDNYEGQSTAGYIAPLNLDTDHDGVDNAYDTDHGGTRVIPVDTDSALSDGDGIPDFLDADSDNDWVPDYIEGHDLNADGKPDFVLRGKDVDADGLDDGFDTVNRYASQSTNMTGSNAAMQDFEGDGQNDWRDENDDDDLYLTRFEDLNVDGNYSNDDTDFDGHPEYLDYGRDCDLFVPEAFSPNDDNIHDYFQIYCINHFPNAKMYIFDQLGNKLFEKARYGNLDFWLSHDRAWWNGKPEFGPSKVRNEIVPPGTYYYVLDLGNGEVKKSFVFVSY